MRAGVGVPLVASRSSRSFAGRGERILWLASFIPSALILRHLLILLISFPASRPPSLVDEPADTLLTPPAPLVPVIYDWLVDVWGSDCLHVPIMCGVPMTALRIHFSGELSLPAGITVVRDELIVVDHGAQSIKLLEVARLDFVVRLRVPLRVPLRVRLRVPRAACRMRVRVRVRVRVHVRVRVRVWC
eukprot:6182096-Pleurochrysis_carterae.AAC.2